MTGMTNIGASDFAITSETQTADQADWIVVAAGSTATDANAEDHGEAAAHTEVAHEESGGMPQFDTTTFANQFVWLAISLVAVYFILAKIGLPRIGSVLEQRSNTIQRDLDRAAELKSKAQQAEENYQQALIDARSKANAIAEDAKAKAQAKLDAAIEKADAELEKQAKASAKKIADMQKDADKSVAEIAKDVSAAVMEALSPSGADAKAINASVTKLLKG